MGESIQHNNAPTERFQEDTRCPVAIQCAEHELHALYRSDAVWVEQKNILMG